MVKDVLEKLKMDKPLLAPLHVWHAYEQLEEVKGKSPKSELVEDDERTYCYKFSY